MDAYWTEVWLIGSASLLTAFAAWWITKVYYGTHLDAMEEVVKDVVRQNAILKVSLAARDVSGDAQRICSLTLAALNAGVQGGSHNGDKRAASAVTTS
jgi:hypothetical protein